ncbi:MAG TPA: PfaD family polyunsaturated fatty acid/polyketide biosynthesis protein, partial [Anaerolineae bacterium]|nr:PfaD family polyunsaturated fatty acid/polyketide biosynthesis protein [Anaerolineae bacterium]
MDQIAALAAAPPLQAERLGDRNFRATHQVKYAYASGSMANGIACEELVIAMGKERLLSSFGAAGLPPARVEAAIHRIQEALPQGPYAFNLIHSPSEDALERGAVELYLKYGVSTVEASAFLDLTPHVVRYRVAGLALNAQNQIEIKNKVIAKLSRREVAMKFMEPAPTRILRQLVQQGFITELQATLAEKVPLADDITVEADSGGHTDNRPLVGLLPSILSLRDEIQAKYRYPTPVRVGAAGGISTPTSALAAFMMGAAYVVSGSVNQSCLEAGASQHTKKLLAEADMADVIMAPAADMFEMGVKVQVLKRGTLFPMRAQKLFDLYRAYDSIEEIPLEEREKLEKQIFKRSIESVWSDTVAFFTERDPDQITRAADNPKRKMALIFRW